MRLFLLLATLTLPAIASYAQDTRDTYQLSLQKAEGDITLDGQLLEVDWQQAELINEFMNQWPIDSGKAEAVTEVRVTYDNDCLYVGAVCYDHGKRIIQSLRRDNDGHWTSDGFTVTLDPINERTNGFMFGVNEGGAQMEGVLTVNSWGTDGDRN